MISNVGALRKILAGISDDTPVVLQNGEGDVYTDLSLRWGDEVYAEYVDEGESPLTSQRLKVSAVLKMEGQRWDLEELNEELSDEEASSVD